MHIRWPQWGALLGVALIPIVIDLARTIVLFGEGFHPSQGIAVVWPMVTSMPAFTNLVHWVHGPIPSAPGMVHGVYHPHPPRLWWAANPLVGFSAGMAALWILAWTILDWLVVRQLLEWRSVPVRAGWGARGLSALGFLAENGAWLVVLWGGSQVPGLRIILGGLLLPWAVVAAKCLTLFWKYELGSALTPLRATFRRALALRRELWPRISGWAVGVLATEVLAGLIVNLSANIVWTVIWLVITDAIGIVLIGWVVTVYADAAAVRQIPPASLGESS